jgi:IPT/TIG domain
MPIRMSVLLVAVVLALSCLPGCSNALNPLCGSARPVPLIGALSPSSMDFAQVQQGAVLTVNGSHFVSSSEVVINGTTLATTVVNSNQLKVTITTGLIPAPGAFNVTVVTPSGNTGDLGCSSGGTSSALVLTIS